MKIEQKLTITVVSNVKLLDIMHVIVEKGEVNGKQVSFMKDPGADMTLIREDLVDSKNILQGQEDEMESDDDTPECEVEHVVEVTKISEDDEIVIGNISSVNIECTTSPYRPQSNGRCERFNGTLKSMLKNLYTESTQEWDELVPYALFAYREVPHEETGFSPLELLYGWPVRGLIAILCGLFTGEDEIHRSVIEHVITICDRLADMSGVVKKNLSHRNEKIKAWYYKCARFREFKHGVGEEVQLLFPSEASKNNADALSRI
ncbi:unnamed protein product [Mytilus coruscus]|uniref:Integrase catalytic domain-containing protein n=1 Tax=Mytilus coruscus TaxID=42192 RepID=A0A6J8AJG4_MYTCO|nr:unnamed protein product [Mytilus coruscus]